MFKNDKLNNIFLSIIGGLILGLAWPSAGIPVLLFFGLIPFLIIEEKIYRYPINYKPFAVLFYTYPGLIIWNAITSYWIVYATIAGALTVIFINSLLIAGVFQAFHFCRKKLLPPYLNRKNYQGYLILILFWLSYEYLHLNWELAWGWLHLGNGLANLVKSIQWYEYTGVLGGSLWILLINILFFILLRTIPDKLVINQQKHKLFILTILCIIIPFVISLKIFKSYEEKPNPVSVVVVQPNIDPYNKKFRTDYFDSIWNRLFQLSERQLDENVTFLVWPETSIPGRFRISDLNESEAMHKIRTNIFIKHPDLNLICGANAYEVYDFKASPTARTFSDGECCWDAFNTSYEINHTGLKNFYHKSKLVPGVERMPYPQFFGFLERFALDLGGTKGSLGMSTESKVFNSSGIAIAPIICYESVFGEYTAEFVKKGANLIFIMTNDGWWGDTPGYKQHLTFARLRAIETRRSVARSANTGISCFVDQKGIYHQKIGWWQEASIKQSLNANDKITVYVKYGDFLGRISLFASIIIILIVIVRQITKKKNSIPT